MNASNRLVHDWFPRPLPENVELGEGSWLYSSFAFLHCRSRRPCALKVGRSSGIYNGSFFELGLEAEVRIGDYCTLVGATIVTNGSVHIGDYCFVAHEVFIGDSPFATPWRESGDVPSVGERTCVELGDDVWVGAGAVLLKGARIGDGAIVGAAAVVDFEVPPYGIVGGNPARLLGFAKSTADR
jgi:acetyltransferase-like isoleucine patch superfamily enzyme